MIAPISELKSELHAAGWRENYGLLIPPEQQVRDGLADGWGYGDIEKFMVATGVARDTAKAAIAQVRSSEWKPCPASRMVAAWLRTTSLPPPRPIVKREGITDFDREAVAKMFTFLGYPRRADKAMTGFWDRLEITQALAAYRIRFEADEEMDIQSARAAAAEYLDILSRRTFGMDDDINAPGLRLGWDTACPVARAFIYQHKRLCRKAGEPA